LAKIQEGRVLLNKFPHLFYLRLSVPALFTPLNAFFFRFNWGSSGKWYWGYLRILLMHFPRLLSPKPLTEQ